MALWRRLATLTRNSSAATPKERQQIAVLARDTGVEAIDEVLTDSILVATLQAHMPLWEAMVDARQVLPWLGARCGCFPHPLLVIEELQIHGYSVHGNPHGMGFEERLLVGIKMIQGAVAREPPMWPLNFESRPNGDDTTRQPSKSCALIVITTDHTRVFVAVAPFESSTSDRSDAAIYIGMQTGPVVTFTRGKALVCALAENHRGDPLLSDEARVGHALASDRVHQLGALAIEAVGRGTPETLGLRPTSARSLLDRLANFVCRPEVMAMAYYLSMSRCTHAVHLTSRDLVTILDVLAPPVDGARDHLDQSTLRNIAADAIARNPALCLSNHVLNALDRESVALVAARLFRCCPQKVAADGDLLERVADALEVSDTHVPLGSDQHRARQCRAIAFAIVRRYASRP